VVDNRPDSLTHPPLGCLQACNPLPGEPPPPEQCLLHARAPDNCASTLLQGEPKTEGGVHLSHTGDSHAHTIRHSPYLLTVRVARTFRGPHVDPTHVTSAKGGHPWPFCRVDLACGSDVGPLHCLGRGYAPC
jgi:hypothetical protein